ncbi:MAG: hypothetical protein ACD_37C00302G0001 [uncultured bacterium]|nr:MAG: hypothetical protein ACD_37C00302G0001 [uncultured bacterium]
MVNPDIENRIQILFQPVLFGLEEARERAEIKNITDEIDVIIRLNPGYNNTTSRDSSHWQRVEIDDLEEGENAFVEFIRQGTGESTSYTIYGAVFLKGNALRSDRIASISKAGVSLPNSTGNSRRHDPDFRT